MVWPALIGAAGNILGGVLGSGSSARAASKAWSRQKRFAKRQYVYATKSMRDAGLNPILAAGGGVHAGGSNIQMSPDPGALGRGVSGAFGAYLAAKQAKADLGKTEQDTITSDRTGRAAMAAGNASNARAARDLQEADRISRTIPGVKSEQDARIKRELSAAALNSAKAANAEAALTRIQFESSMPGILLRNVPDAIRAGATSAAAAARIIKPPKGITIRR